MQIALFAFGWEILNKKSYDSDFELTRQTFDELISMMFCWNHFGFSCALRSMHVLYRKITPGAFLRPKKKLWGASAFSLQILLEPPGPPSSRA